MKTVQEALKRATPGTTINLAPGVYREQPSTVRAGTAAAPITIKGPESGYNRSGRYRAIVYGTGLIFNINHSHYVLRGFTIDGQERLANVTYPTQLADVRAFKDRIQERTYNTKLIYIASNDSAHDLTDIVISDMFLSGSGGECVRLRNNAYHNVIENSVIQWCGMRAGKNVGGYAYHNGEGVYIGTSPKSTEQPLHANDRSSQNIVRHNVIHTFGAECFDVKENAHDNRFEDNECRYNDEPASVAGSNIELRGDHNVVRNNVIADSRGWNILIASDNTSFDRGGNTVQGNRFAGASGPSIRTEARENGPICGNSFGATKDTIAGRTRPDPSAPCMPHPQGLSR